MMNRMDNPELFLLPDEERTQMPALDSCIR